MKSGVVMAIDSVSIKFGVSCDSVDIRIIRVKAGEQAYWLLTNLV